MRWRLLLGAAGCAVGAYGVLLVVGLGPQVRNVLVWALGGLLLHDLVLAPLVLGAGWALARLRVPRPVRVGVQVAVVVGGTTLVATAPTILAKRYVGYEPGLLPQDYAVGVLVVAVVAALVGAASGLAAWRGQRRSAARGQLPVAPPA